MHSPVMTLTKSPTGNHSGPEVFLSEDRYSDDDFRGIIPDTGATDISTGGIAQARALLKHMPHLSIETSEVSHNVRFGDGGGKTDGFIRIPTTFGTIDFQFLPLPTPSLFSITDMVRPGIV